MERDRAQKAAKDYGSMLIWAGIALIITLVVVSIAESKSNVRTTAIQKLSLPVEKGEDLLPKGASCIARALVGQGYVWSSAYQEPPWLLRSSTDLIANGVVTLHDGRTLLVCGWGVLEAYLWTLELSETGEILGVASEQALSLLDAEFSGITNEGLSLTSAGQRFALISCAKSGGHAGGHALVIGVDPTTFAMRPLGRVDFAGPMAKMLSLELHGLPTQNVNDSFRIAATWRDEIDPFVSKGFAQVLTVQNGGAQIVASNLLQYCGVAGGTLAGVAALGIDNLLFAFTLASPRGGYLKSFKVGTLPSAPVIDNTPAPTGILIVPSDYVQLGDSFRLELARPRSWVFLAVLGGIHSQQYIRTLRISPNSPSLSMGPSPATPMLMPSFSLPPRKRLSFPVLNPTVSAAGGAEPGTFVALLVPSTDGPACEVVQLEVLDNLQLLARSVPARVPLRRGTVSVVCSAGDGYRLFRGFHKDGADGIHIETLDMSAAPQLCTVAPRDLQRSTYESLQLLTTTVGRKFTTPNIKHPALPSGLDSNSYSVHVLDGVKTTLSPPLGRP